MLYYNLEMKLQMFIPQRYRIKEESTITHFGGIILIKNSIIAGKELYLV